MVNIFIVFNFQEQGKKLTEYEARISEMTNELNLLRKEKSVSDSLAFQSATDRDEFLKKHEKLYEEKNVNFYLNN